MKICNLFWSLILASPAFGVTPVFPVDPVFTEPKPEPKDYSACLSAVEQGKTVYLSVGVKPTEGDYHTSKLVGFPPGRYQCGLIGGKPKMWPASVAPLSLPSYNPGGS